MILSGTYVDKAKRGTIDQRNVQLTNIYTTLAKVAGVEKNPILSGLDLLNPSQNRLGSFSELHEAGGPAYMWRTKEWKLILYTDLLKDGKTMGELYIFPTTRWNTRTYNALQRETMKTDLLMHLANVWSAFPLAR